MKLILFLFLLKVFTLHCQPANGSYDVCYNHI